MIANFVTSIFFGLVTINLNSFSYTWISFANFISTTTLLASILASMPNALSIGKNFSPNENREVINNKDKKIYFIRYPISSFLKFSLFWLILSKNNLCIDL